MILTDCDEIDNEASAWILELVNINRLRGQPRIGHQQQPRKSSSSNDPMEDLSLEDYFQRFVMEHQDSMSETELAQKLGVSRKCLWERRQRRAFPQQRGSGKPAQEVRRPGENERYPTTPWRYKIRGNSGNNYTLSTPVQYPQTNVSICF